MTGNNSFAFLPYQPDNPTDQERHMLAIRAFSEARRPEDYPYVTRELQPPPDITTIMRPGTMKKVRVGIIGGGLAGLSAAYELRKLGCSITIFDPIKDRIGGRIYTYYFNKDKTLYGEFGAMRIPVTHEVVWHYIKLFGLPTRPFVQNNENALVYLRNVRVTNDFDGQNVKKYIYPRYRLSNWERQLNWQTLVYLGYDKEIEKASPEVRSEILKVQQLYSSETLFWDGINSRQLQERQNLSNEAISMISNFVPLAGESLYNSYIDYVQERYSVDLSYLYEIPGGMARLPQAFCNSFTYPDTSVYYPGVPDHLLGTVDFRCGNWVSGIYKSSNGPEVILAVNDTNTRKPLYENFDYVVCAIPFSALRTIDIKPLFSPGKMQAIREVNYINAQKTLFLCKRRFWEEGGSHGRILGGASYTDLPITTLWYPSDHICNKIVGDGNPYNCYQSNLAAECNSACSQYAPGPGVLLAYSFRMEATRLANMVEGVRFEEMKREIEEVHGLPRNYLNEIIPEYKVVNWNTEPWFRNALSFFTPEQKRIFSSVMTIPEYDGHIYMAGEHISAKHRWMQGALDSGMRAANSIACSFSKL